MNKQFSLKTLLLASPLLLTTVHAYAQPKAEDLVGKVYAGAHLLYMNTDNDRLMTSDPASSVDHGSGFGAELGYRLNEYTEFRFSYSNINLVPENPGFSAPDSSNAALDVLYFPTKKNIYLLAGFDYLDIVNTKPSLDLGVGYRYFINDRSAFYIEGKGYNQIAKHFKDLSANVGFIYFFGDNAKTSPVKKQQPQQVQSAVAAIAVLDTDKDGIVDNKDQCADTPQTDKVDSYGCTLFSEENTSIELLVNFDNGQAIVKKEFYPEIEKMATFLKMYPDTSLVIEGHTSKVGSEAFNKELSQQRANAIVDLLVNKFAIESNRLSAVGYGEERLLDHSNSKAADAKNRRIEAKLEVTKKVAVSR